MHSLLGVHFSFPIVASIILAHCNHCTDVFVEIFELKVVYFAEKV